MKVDVSEVVAATASGHVRGRMTGGVAAFKGIPYAEPPFGDRRFQPPEPHHRWQGALEAFDYGPTVPKPPYFPPFDTLLPEPAIPGEECLNVNVWTPDPATKGLPVMVWIHGGAFANGSNAVPTYDGSAFARDGVVCVGVNYRLGVDGFLFLDDGIANLGLLDQLAALRWVQENIAAFGGDAGKVTIAGESAGAMSVSTLMSMPLSEGLFRRVIAESGAGHHALTPGTAKKVGGYLAERLGIPASREAFAEVPLDHLYMAQMELSLEAFAAPDPERWGEVAANLMPFEPVLDGRILPSMPIKAKVEGAGAHLDLLIGTNSGEENLFLVPNQMIDLITEEMLDGVVAAYQLPKNALDVYRSTRPGASPGELMSAITTDWFFRMPAIRLAEAHATSSAGNYVYEFTWRSPAFGGRLGACHASEIAFVFDNLDQTDNDKLLGLDPPQGLADEMHSAWVKFVSTGDPGWPRYEATGRSVMRFGTASEIVADPDAEERRLWDGIR